MNLHNIRQLAEALDPFTKNLSSQNLNLVFTHLQHQLRHTASGSVSPSASNGLVIHKLVKEILNNPIMTFIRVTSKSNPDERALLIRAREVFYEVLRNQDIQEETVDAIFGWFNQTDDEALQALSENPMITLWHLENPNHENQYINRAIRLFLKKHPEAQASEEKVYTFHKLESALAEREKAWNNQPNTDDDIPDDEDDDRDNYSGHAGFNTLEAILRDFRRDKVVWNGSDMYLQTASTIQHLRDVPGTRYYSAHYAPRVRPRGSNYDQYVAMTRLLQKLDQTYNFDVQDVVDEFAMRFDDISDQAQNTEAIEEFLSYIEDRDEPDQRGY